MLRITVTRESDEDVVAIGEVVIGKFAGTEKRGGYAARVFEPPSRYSDGTDACFTVRGHERYQPAMALVASVLAAWREGRIDEVGEGIRAALTTAASPSIAVAMAAAAPTPAPAPARGDGERAAAALRAHAADPAMAALTAAVLAVAEKLERRS
ncbi:MAG: hypothetical protein WCJ64_27980 [Rhodospirillaceae bacterium]